MIALAFALGAAVACGVAALRAAGGHGTLAVAGGTALGLGLCGAAFGAGLLLLGATGPWTDLALLSAAAALWTRAGPRGAKPLHEPAPWLLKAACALAAVLVAALFVEHSLRYPEGGWDAVAIWNLRARALFGAPHDPGLVFTPALAATHPDYPPLLPALLAHGFFALGRPSEFLPIGVSFLFAASCVLTLAEAASARRGPVAGLVAALLLLGTPQLLTLAWNQYADLKLAALLLVAVVFATGGSAPAAGLAAGLGACTKNEGSIWLAALLFALFRAQGARAAMRFVAGAAGPLLLLAAFKLRWAPPNDLLSQLSLAQVARGLPGRMVPVARGLALQVVDFGAWGCAPALVLASLVARRKRRQRTVAALFCAPALAAVCCIYLATPHEVVEHMRSSLDRLLFQLWPAFLYAWAISPCAEAVAPLSGPRRFHRAAAASTNSAPQPGQSPSTS